MGTIHRYPAAKSLAPADLDIAARIYVEVAERLALPAEDRAGRERVAHMIVAQMLSGERDPIRLRDGALSGWGRMKARADEVIE